MKKFNLFIYILLLLSYNLVAQSKVEAGSNQTITCDGSAQLSAFIPLNHSYEIINTGFSFSYTSIFVLNDSIIYSVGTLGTILRSTNAGKNWQSINSATSNVLRNIKFYNKNLGIIVGDNGTILRSTNDGLTWDLIGSGVSSSLKSVCFVNEETIFICSTDGIILKSINGGATWTIVTTISSTYIQDILFINKYIGFVVGNYGVIYKTMDGGITWNLQNNSTINTSLNKILFVNDSRGFSIGTGTTLLKTIDGGNKWSKVYMDTVYSEYSSSYADSISKGTDPYPLKTCIFNSIKFINANIGFLVGYKTTNVGFVLKTTDGGNTWKPILSENSNKFMVADFYSENIGFVGGTSNYLNKITSINVPDNGVYRWSPTNGLDNPNIANPKVSISNTTSYKVTRTDNGASTIDSLIVTVLPLSVSAGNSKTITCAGSVQLDYPSSNFNDLTKLKYKWTPALGLNSDTVASPIASPTANTIYFLTITSPSGCTATSGITVTVSSFKVNLSNSNPFICGNSQHLQSVTTNYSGIGVLKYKWTPAIGLDNDTLANPLITAGSSNITYTLTVKTPTGCTASTGITIIPVKMTLDVGANKTTVCGAPVQLGVVSTNYTGQKLKYKWTPATGLDNDTIAQPMASPNKKTTYTLTILNPQGCIATDSLVVDVTGLTAPAISYVQVNENNKNSIRWIQPTVGKVTAYNIYKETNVSNNFVKIGVVNSGTALQFVDSLSLPDTQSNKYKISVLDECGVESNLSTAHKSMHLTINKGIGAVWNLIWESYEGFTVSTYNIYRGTDKSNIRIIASLSGSNNQFSDFTATERFVYYQIEATAATSSGIVGQKVAQNSNTALLTTISSRSNIASNTTYINKLNTVNDISQLISVYPVPASDKITIEINIAISNNAIFKLFNALGQLVGSYKMETNNVIIDISNLSKAVYFGEFYNGHQKGRVRIAIK